MQAYYIPGLKEKVILKHIFDIIWKHIIQIVWRKLNQAPTGFGKRESPGYHNLYIDLWSRANRETRCAICPWEGAVLEAVFKVFHFSVLAKIFVGKFGKLKNILTGITGADLSLFLGNCKSFPSFERICPPTSKGFVHRLEKDLTTDSITIPQDLGLICSSVNAIMHK